MFYCVCNNSIFGL